MRQEFLFVEKYRPQTINECILPEKLKAIFNSLVKKGEVINLLLNGTPGTGKTTVAKAVCNEMGCDYIVVNGSDEGRSIDILRSTIKQFATTVSNNGKPKVVIIDEADYLGYTVQPALRNFIEEYSSNCRFILTCNYKHKIIEPLHSRCSVIDFSIDRKDLPALAGSLMTRVTDILDNEGIKYDKPALVEVIKRYFPDMRRILNELQRYSNISGEINLGVLSQLDTSKIKTFIKHMKAKDFISVRQWIADNTDTETLFTELFTNSKEYVSNESVPTLVLILADYQFKASHVANQEINLAACAVELMKNVRFI